MVVNLSTNQLSRAGSLEPIARPPLAGVVEEVEPVVVGPYQGQFSGHYKVEEDSQRGSVAGKEVVVVAVVAAAGTGTGC